MGMNEFHGTSDEVVSESQFLGDGLPPHTYGSKTTGMFSFEEKELEAKLQTDTIEFQKQRVMYQMR